MRAQPPRSDRPTDRSTDRPTAVSPGVRDGRHPRSALCPWTSSAFPVTRNMVEFQAHRANAHPWQCPACANRNSGLSFPRCELCGNGVGPDGEDLERGVAEAVEVVLQRVR